MEDITISIVGGGNMTSALLAGLFQQNIIASDHILVTNRSAGKLEQLEKRYGVRISYNNLVAADFADVLVLSVKPIDMKAACEQVRPRISEHKLVISLAAGIRINTLKKWLCCKRIPVVRVMSNTPSQIGYGMSGWTSSSEVTDSQTALVRRLLRALGNEIGFQDEEALDQVTAISGSGPAYIFYLAELLTESATAIGLKEAESKELVLQTIYGAAAMLRANGKAASELRAAVTSKGGTTEAAIREMAKQGLEQVIKSGVQAAYDRGKEIGLQWARL